MCYDEIQFEQQQKKVVYRPFPWKYFYAVTWLKMLIGIKMIKITYIHNIYTSYF